MRPSWDTALILGILVVFGTGMLRGGMYSAYLPYRLQTEALLNGHLGLGTDIKQLTWDLVWDQGELQQVWGLAVPAWRLPFEVAAKLCGLVAFPDRIEFGIALVLVFYVCLKFHWWCMGCCYPSLPQRWQALAAVPLVLSPPVLTLCMSKFEAYEEATAYGILASMILFTWTVRLWIRPSITRFALVSIFSGLLPLIRPTFLAYGVSSVIIGGLLLWQKGYRRSVFMVAPLGCLGMLIILWTNQERFGSPFEFGHKLNVNTLAPMRYAARFDDPFRTAPMTSAAVELISFSFLNRTPPGTSWPWAYAQGMFSGQSEIFRWREPYLSTFDLSWLFCLLGTWGWLGRKCWVNWAQRSSIELEVIGIAALWTIVPVILLLTFYLRCPFLSSRYILDLSPALTMSIWVIVPICLDYARKSRTRPWARYLPALLLAWWGYEVMSVKVIGRLSPITRQEAILRVVDVRKAGDFVTFPRGYDDVSDAQKTGIPFNGSGWDSSGETAASVLLFVNDPQCVILKLAPATGTPLSTADCECIRAKIGLENLERLSMRHFAGGVTIEFRGPKSKRYQAGIQQMTLAMVAPAELNAGHSKFELLGVRWKWDTSKANVVTQ